MYYINWYMDLQLCMNRFRAYIERTINLGTCLIRIRVPENSSYFKNALQTSSFLHLYCGVLNSFESDYRASVFLHRPPINRTMFTFVWSYALNRFIRR